MRFDDCRQQHHASKKKVMRQHVRGSKGIVMARSSRTARQTRIAPPTGAWEHSSKIRVFVERACVSITTRRRLEAL